jgi:hypothetical protein
MSTQELTDYGAENIPSLTEGVPESLLESKLFKVWLQRLSHGRDLKVIIDAEGNETGVGKTLLGRQLSGLFDIHGFSAEEKATMDVREYMDIYRSLPEGSSPYLQESEKSGDKRRGMSDDVMNLGYTFAILRKRQMFPILDLPDATVLDDRIIKLCDFRILVKERGVAMVFEIDNNDFTGELYNTKVEELKWENMPRDKEYEKLEEMKEKWITGELKSKYVKREEFEKAKENFYEKFTNKTRFHVARGVWELLEERGLTGKGGEISQADLGAALGYDNEELELSQVSISNILNAESFGDYYGDR